MTDKRFRVETIEEELYPMPIYYDEGKKLGYVEMVHLLNKLHEENQILKKELLWWKYRCGEDIGESDKMTDKRFTHKMNQLGMQFICYDDKAELLGTFADADGVTHIVKLLNELHEENQLKLEMIDAFIRGLEDEKGIAPEDREFQCRMNHTIKVLKELKRDMLHPSEFKRLRELEE